MVKYNTENLSYKMAGIYCYIKDFMDFLDKRNIKIDGSNKRGVKSKITEAEVISIGIFRCCLGMDCIKSFYLLGNEFLKKHFPELPKYEGFIKALNRTIHTQMIMMQILLMMAKMNTKSSLFFADATDYPVCKIKREFGHKLFKEFARKGKSSMGWFYGFKLHLVTDDRGYLLAMKITTGEVNERKPLDELLSHLQGTVIMDAAYLSADLINKFAKQGLHYFTAVKKNMKKLMTEEQHYQMKKRQSIETRIGLLKQRLALLSTLTRSVRGFIARICCTVLAYIFNYHRGAPQFAI